MEVMQPLYSIQEAYNLKGIKNMTTLAEIRAKLQRAETRQSSQGSSSGENYPFWNLPNDKTSRLRFLPDANQDNTFFWRERQLISLTFPGIKGHDESKEVTIKVPCMEMYGKTCPILTEVRPWWGTDMEELARKYWVKRAYIFQGFVRESDLVEDEVPENPIRKFVIGPQIYQIIKSQLLDPEMESIPTDYIEGVDFVICKTQKGKWPDYSTSKWARRESSLTTEELEAVEKYGLKDLSDHLPKMPTEEQVSILFDMFQDSLEGNLYDPEKYAAHFRPYGFDYNGNGSNSDTAPQKASSVREEKEDKPFVNDVPVREEPKAEAPKPSSGGGKSAEDILAQIRNRSKSQ